MKAKKLVWVSLFLASIPVVAAQRPVRFAAPDGHIQFEFRTNDGLPVYTVSYDKEVIVKSSELSLRFAGDGGFGTGFRIVQVRTQTASADYTLLTGKTSSVHEIYIEASITLKEKLSPHRQILLQVRIYNDGLAFRYSFPEQPGWTSYDLLEEGTHFNLKGDPRVTARFLPGFTTSHEARAQTLPMSELKADSLMDLPLLVSFPSKVYMAITEAALVDYAGMYLVKHNGNLQASLSPLPGSEVKVKAKLPHQTPWRVLLISKRIGALIESNILTSLNEPNKILDVSWIRPGTSDFHWWNGDILPDTTFPPQEDFLFNKYYIDFCARHHITYHTVIGYGGYPWYKSDAEGYGVAGKLTDVTQTVPTLDMKAICDYAKSQNVGIRVWVHWQAIYPNLEKSFAQFHRWGIAGMMVDFLDRDDQQMVNIQREILETAARYQLHIQFHGAYKPTGLHRTYPNEFTREGTLNYENDKWGNPINADDDISIPFTRMLAGATDYHLGGFRAVTDSGYHVQYTRPLVLSTRCHMLAMYIVLESYLQMVCDFPDAYEGQPGFEVLENLPTVWDETKVISAELNEYIAIARRRGKDWWVGVITNHQPRTLDLPLHFLSSGKYAARLYTDAVNAASDPNQLQESQQTLEAGQSLHLALAGAGGAFIHFKSE